MRRGGLRGRVLRAFTLVELIATIVVLSVVAGLSAPLVLQLSRSVTVERGAQRALAEQSRAMLVATDLLRSAVDQAESGTSGLETIGPASLVLEDGRGLELVEGTLYATRGSERYELLRDVESFSVRSFQEDGSTDASAAPELARRVEIDLAAGTARLSSAVALSVPGRQVTLTWALADEGEVYLNGQEIGRHDSAGNAVSRSLVLPEGDHVLALRARDTSGTHQVLFDIASDWGQLGSGDRWFVSTSGKGDWTDPTFDDTAWARAEIRHGVYGDPGVPSVTGAPDSTPARWIWSGSDGDAEVVMRAHVRVTEDDMFFLTPGALDFDEVPVVVFDSLQDGHYGLPASHEIVDGGAGVRLNGNAWRSVALPYTITANTVLEFEFAATGVGEIQGVELAKVLNAIVDAQRIKVSGPQANVGYAPPIVPAYTGAGEYQSYTIEMGALVPAFPFGVYNHLVFVNDDDVLPIYDAMYRNVRMFERP